MHTFQEKEENNNNAKKRKNRTELQINKIKEFKKKTKKKRVTCSAMQGFMFRLVAKSPTQVLSCWTSIIPISK